MNLGKANPGEVVVRSVLGHKSADEQQVATRLKAEPAERIGAAVRRRVGAIGDQLGRSLVRRGVVALHGFGISDHDAAAPGRDRFAPPDIPPSQTPPLCSLPLPPAAVQTTSPPYDP